MGSSPSGSSQQLSSAEGVREYLEVAKRYGVKELDVSRQTLQS